MDAEKKENEQEVQQKEVLSILDEKRKELFDKVEDLMEKMGEDFGPVFQEELHRRLEFVVQNFNEEVKTLFSEYFEKWQVKDTQIRDLMGESMQLSESLHVKSNDNDSSMPEFIKDVKFGPIRPE